MLDKFLMGVTGGIASGKSFACTMLNRVAGAGFHHLDVDTVRRRIIDEAASCEAWRKIHGALVRYFGAAILSESGVIDRRKLSESAFRSRGALSFLNATLNPQIRFELEECARPLSGLIVIEDALLVERGLLSLVGYNVLHVRCSPRTQLHRLQHSDLSRAQLLRRIEAQGSADAREASIRAQQRAVGAGELHRFSTEGAPGMAAYEALFRRIFRAGRAAYGA